MAQLNTNYQEQNKQSPIKSQKSKNSKQLLIFIILLIIVILGGFFLFSNLDETEKETNYAAEAKKEQEIIPLPPKKEEVGYAEDLNEQINEEFKQEADIKVLFDENAIDKVLEEAQKEEVKKIDKDDIDTKIAEIKKDLGFNNLETVVNNSTTEKSVEKKNMDFLKSNIKIRVNFFNFNGKNYYEGDEILGYKIKEVTKTNIVLSKNGKTTNLNFKDIR